MGRYAHITQDSSWRGVTLPQLSVISGAAHSEGLSIYPGMRKRLKGPFSALIPDLGISSCVVKEKDEPRGAPYGSSQPEVDHSL